MHRIYQNHLLDFNVLVSERMKEEKRNFEIKMFNIPSCFSKFRGNKNREFQIKRFNQNSNSKFQNF